MGSLGSSPTALSLADLHARMAAQVTHTVAAGYVPSAARLARLLRPHVEAGEVELREGRYALTAVGAERYGVLLEADDPWEIAA